MKDWAEERGDVRVMEITGCSFTSLTRTKLPYSGAIEGNWTLRSKVGVKLAGMTFDGSRLALRSESRRALAAMVIVQNVLDDCGAGVVE